MLSSRFSIGAQIQSTPLPPLFLFPPPGVGRKENARRLPADCWEMKINVLILRVATSQYFATNNIKDEDEKNEKESVPFSTCLSQAGSQTESNALRRLPSQFEVQKGWACYEIPVADTQTQDSHCPNRLHTASTASDQNEESIRV